MRASARKVGVSIVIVAMVAAFALWAFLDKDRFAHQALQGRDHPAVGKTLSHFRLTPLTNQGEEVALGDLSGKVVVVNFWATWCAPCWQELPHMIELRAKYKNRKDVLFFSISSSEGHLDQAMLKTETESVLARFGKDLPIYSDPQSITFLGLPEPIGKTGYPKTLILDKRGIIQGVWEGYTPGVELSWEKIIEEILSRGGT